MLFLAIFTLMTTLEEKVGQLLMVHLHREEAKTLVQNLHVGGVIYYNWSNDLTEPALVCSLSAELQALATVPLLIAVDQEGGRVERLQFLHFPSNSAIGEIGDPAAAEQMAFAIGQGLRDVGINMNLAPVVDVSGKDRSFGSSPELVQQFAARALTGYQRAGVLTSLKHYPGLGDAEVDSHMDLPVLHKSIERGVAPFAQLASQADTIMTAHLLVPAIDAESCATLSKPILDLLREQIGFQGVILSDSLVMEGVLKNCNYSVEEAAIRAFNAGCDILMLAGKQLIGSSDFELSATDVQRIHGALVEAVRDGRISEAQVDRSLQRILELKKPLWGSPME